MTDTKVELMVANKTIREAEEAFDRPRQDYHALREHTDMLEALLREHKIPFLEFGGGNGSCFSEFNCYITSA